VHDLDATNKKSFEMITYIFKKFSILIVLYIYRRQGEEEKRMRERKKNNIKI